MIRLTRLNHAPIYLNSDLIEHVELTPDTVITLTNGQRFMVLESPDEVVQRICDFRRAIHIPAEVSKESELGGPGQRLSSQGCQTTDRE
ncbi:MAG: flagellar FlbD family protein [Bryobacteraceae bacterium]|nr:flagellar FlbD family protein [Bryobacteraceae bacterium]MDW8379436.1 flagellar FlbD family protein [Bryobacterales bacterium]